MSWIYGFQCGEFIKIGRSDNVGRRLRDLRLGNPNPVKIVLRRRHVRAALVERLMHRVLREEAVGREWFKISPADARLAADHAIAKVNERMVVEAERRASHLAKKLDRTRKVAHLSDDRSRMVVEPQDPEKGGPASASQAGLLFCAAGRSRPVERVRGELRKTAIGLKLFR